MSRRIRAASPDARSSRRRCPRGPPTPRSGTPTLTPASGWARMSPRAARPPGTRRLRIVGIPPLPARAARRDHRAGSRAEGPEPHRPRAGTDSCRDARPQAGRLSRRGHRLRREQRRPVSPRGRCRAAPPTIRVIHRHAAPRGPAVPSTQCVCPGDADAGALRARPRAPHRLGLQRAPVEGRAPAFSDANAFLLGAGQRLLSATSPARNA